VSGAASSGVEAGEDFLLTLPAGWSVIDAGSLLGASIPQALNAALDRQPESPEAVALIDEFADNRRRFHDSRIALVAARTHAQESFELLTLALPDPAGETSETSETSSAPRAAPAAGGAAEREEDDGEELVLPGGRAVVHRGLAALKDLGDWARSGVQIVFFLPGDRRGAVLTLLSSRADGQQELEREAIGIVRSVAGGDAPPSPPDPAPPSRPADGATG